MKIKVVDMPYEQALAQPREKHTPPRRPSMLFHALLRALSAPDLRATHFRCDRVGMERLGPDEPCLVLMNHSCFLDLKITAAVLYPRPFNIVCTSDGFVGKAGLMRALGCIPTRKFQPDTALVRDMLYAVKKLKSSILLYPEASYSFDGTATPLPESLGKCVKALGVPIVLLRTCGAFARDPLYNGLQNRRVNVSAELRYLLSPEEERFLKHMKEFEYIRRRGYSVNFTRAQYMRRMGLREYTFDRCARSLCRLGLIVKTEDSSRNRVHYRLNEEAYERLVRIVTTTRNIDRLIAFFDLHCFKLGKDILSLTDEEIDTLLR